MRMLLALLLLLCCWGLSTSQAYRFIVFTHDGTFYKLDPENKQVEWHNQLPFKLLSFNFNNLSSSSNETARLFIPTIDGDFVYLEHGLYPRQILVPREDIEHLLDFCFDENEEDKHFIYQKMEYFVLNTQNGQFTHLQDFLSQQKVFNRNLHSIIVVSRKLLKQLTPKMEVKWSVISSKIGITNVQQFADYEKVNTQPLKEHMKYSFVRVDPKTIQILDERHNIVFQIQASSSIVSIFGEDLNKHEFSKIAIKMKEPKMLALPESRDLKNGRSLMENMSGDFTDFEHSGNYLAEDTYSQIDSLQMCVNQHKQMKQGEIAGRDKKIYDFDIQRNSNDFQYLYDVRPQDLPTLPFSTDRRIKVIVTKQQPFVYIFIIAIVVIGGFGFYKFKVNKLWDQFAQEKTISDENIKKIAAKLGEYENAGRELHKMYEVNWSKIIYRKQTHIVFEGRFLNQNAEVFVLPLSGFDIIDIEHKLNILINCSHKSIAKLYYYTRNQDSLLIFCEKNTNLKVLQSLPVDSIIFQKFQKEDDTYKQAIRTLIDVFSQLVNLKIQIESFSEESVLLTQKCQIKINIIPSFWIRTNQEKDKKLIQRGTSRVRVDLVSIVHKMGHKGEEFNLNNFQKQKNTEEEQNSFLKDFYDTLLLREDNISDQQAIKNSSKHPFLWDSKQKLLYVCDFSNYTQTCIDQTKILKMQTHCKNLQIITLPWIKQLHPSFAKQVNSYRKYDFNSVRDLIRLARNKLSHFHEIPKQTRVYVGKTPEQFVEYILQKFPKLLPFMYVYATKKKWKLSTVQ